MKTCLNIAKKAARAAGKILLRYFGKTKNIREKSGRRGLVSIADEESERAIIGIIKKRFPGHNIIAEESGIDHQHSPFTWHIDPLDGTTNYIFGLRDWGTAIGLAKDDKVILGVIYFPLSDELLWAEKGKGAFLNGKRISTSKRDRLKDSLFLFESDLNKDSPLRFNLLKRIVKNTYKIRMTGDAVTSMRRVAEGAADGLLFLRLNDWDVAAGSLIIREAGGKVTTLSGKEWELGDKEFAASNGKIHTGLIKLIGKK
ncbi:inositol monophosphatase [Candidatus Woesearchaeota archaeon]|nr:inositol monophosphatase [Candidatus Woesearchaeota archaeon]